MNRNILRYFWLFFFSLSIIFSPFYFWKSGVPQVSDALMVFSFILFVLFNRGKIKITLKSKIFFKFCFIFVIYVMLINLFWFFSLKSSEFIKSSLYYIYNLLIVSYYLLLHQKHRSELLSVVYVSSLISVLLQMVLFIVGGGFSGRRMVLSFNNPNQLARWGIMIISLMLFSSNHIKVSRKGIVVSLISGFIFVLSSLSKAGIIAYCSMIIMFFLSKMGNKTVKNRILFIILIITTIMAASINIEGLIQRNALIKSSYNRIMSIGKESDDSLEGRGYDRIAKYPEYWVFGAGEGEYDRFGEFNLEFHSTIGNVQVSYGMIGTLLFLSLVLIGMQHDRYRSWALMLGIILYGLTHNGIRDSMFWLFLAMMNSVNEAEEVGINSEYLANSNKLLTSE